MKSITLITLFAILSITNPSFSRIPDSDLPAYIAPYTDTAITEDGKLDEPIWQQAKWSRDFAWIDTGKPLVLQTRFKCIYGSEKLSFALEMEVPAGDPVLINPDFPRAIEVFLDPKGQGHDYMEWAADPSGAQHSNIWRNRVSISQYTSDLNIGTILGVNKVPGKPGREMVTFELSFPWKELGRIVPGSGKLPKRGDQWRMNFSRVDMNEYYGDYTWSIPVMYYLHAPNTFGWLVFAGQKDPITSLDGIKFHRLPDEAELIKNNKHFKLLYRDFFINNIVNLGQDNGMLVAPKSYVTRIDKTGKELWRVTPNDGLPQLNRTFAVTDAGCYIGGDRLGAGAVFVNNSGKVKRLDESDGMQLTGRINITGLSRSRIVFVAGNKYQLMLSGVLHKPVECAGIIKDSAALGDDRLAVGTVSGLEIRDFEGTLITTIPIVGGISKFTKAGSSAIGISGNLGMFKINPDSSWQHFPCPLRIAFNKIFTDSKNRVWAAFTGGFIMVENGKPRVFTEPAGMGAFTVSSIGETASGSIVASCSVPLGTYYNSGRDTGYLLIYKNGKWKKLGYPEGLPGFPNPLTRYGSKLLVGTSAGVYEFIE
jgi:hypothetical protein